jgi:putative ABC transport system permease protein
VSAGYASTLPLSNPAASPVFVREQPLAHDADAPRLDVYLVSSGYLDVMRIPVRRGRAFSADDIPGGAPVAVVSESTAARLFGGEDPIGQHLQAGIRDEHRPWATIIGVVGDVHQTGLDRDPDAAVYLLFAQTTAPQGWARLVVRASLPPERLESTLRDAMVAVDPLQPVFHMQPLSTYVGLSVSERTFTLRLFSSFGMLALLLALGGVYGVMSYQTEQRTRDVGVRLALGATKAHVCWTILRPVLATTAVAMTSGGVVVAATSHVLSALLFDVKPMDVDTELTVACVLLAVALGASALPVWRATRIEPTVALRAE